MGGTPCLSGRFVPAGRAAVIAWSVAAAAPLSGCKRHPPPPPPDPVSSAAASASATPSNVDAGPAWDAFVARMKSTSETLAPYTSERKKTPTCTKRKGEPAVLLDMDAIAHFRIGEHHGSSSHSGRLSAGLGELWGFAFVPADKKDPFLRDMGWKPERAVAILDDVRARPATVLLYASETRPATENGAFTPGRGKGNAYVLDSKGKVCTVTWAFKQGTSVKFKTLREEGPGADEAQNETTKQAFGTVAVDYDYDYGVAQAALQALAAKGWTDVAPPKTPEEAQK